MLKVTGNVQSTIYKRMNELKEFFEDLERIYVNISKLST